MNAKEFLENKFKHINSRQPKLFRTLQVEILLEEYVKRKTEKLIEMWDNEKEEAHTNKMFGKTPNSRAYADGKHTILEWVTRELKRA